MSVQEIPESLRDMKVVECARCSWTWIMHEGQTEADCPFCPKELWGFTLTAPSKTRQ